MNVKKTTFILLICAAIGNLSASEEERIEFEYFFPEGTYRFLHRFPDKQVLNEPPEALLKPELKVESEVRREWKHKDGKVTYEPSWEAHWSYEWKWGN